MISALTSPFVQGIIVTALTDRVAKFFYEKYQFQDAKGFRGITVTAVNIGALLVTHDLYSSFPGFAYGCSLLIMESNRYGRLMNRGFDRLNHLVDETTASEGLQGQMRV